ncbi:DUF6079 family protein [Brachybacterium fresconis]|uniref:Phage resistance protein n=1 Tax=Brachybacterium fresconis TaxID=173363 RepID=A0ABS4YN52_9MICO|nr:DUF6079 family protein [Brachybacterium fresconis]MBP2410221.1 hypothetical protein [Brachybacterium fresconis]
MTAPLLRDVFSIPEATGAEDYVLRLTDATTGRGAAEAIDDYVVTPAIADAFDEALALVTDALGSGLNRGAFLAGSFGSGKSHFMAVLHALLRHDPHARAHQDLQRIITTHDAQLEGKNFLPLSFHFLDGGSMEQVLFDGYVQQIRTRHPEAPLPAVYQADALLRDAENLRTRMGDESFLAALGGESAGDDPFGALLGSSGWSLEEYQTARAAAPGHSERLRLVTALTRREGLFSNYARLGEHVSLDEGLQAISDHAKTLGYDAVVMFLDELVLWLAFEMQNQGSFGREAQKLTKLVEGNYGRLPIPLVSIIARQMDLQQWFADSGASGTQQKALDDAFRHQSGRFRVIELGDDNLAYVAAKRLLTPKDDAAARAIEDAFAGIDRAEGVWDVLLDGINTDETHRGANEQQFRHTYPFSPALVSTLRNLSGVMQRDRTALKVMQQMLVERRDTMRIDEVIPVGDAYEHIVSGNDRSVLDPRRAALFRRADEIFEDKLQPLLLSNNGISAHDLETGDEATLRTYRTDERLAHTLLLSAVAPGVPALTSLTSQRLSSLNHGSITSPLRGGEAGVVAAKVNSWAQRVGDIKVGGSDRNPVYTVRLSDVDYESIVENAKGEDNPGRQRELLRTLVLEAAGVPPQENTTDGAVQHKVVWRGSARTVDLVFGNVRDPQQLPEDRFRHAPDTWRIILDLPFDEGGHSVTDDVRRVEDLMARNVQARTLIWLPRFFSAGKLKDLRTLVILDYLLTGHGDRWRNYSDHLSEADRSQAKVILQGQRDNLRAGILTALLQAYGAATAQPGILTEGSGDQVLWSLDQGHQPRTPGGPTLDRALAQTITEAWDSTFPEHPAFAPEDQVVTVRELDAVAEHISRAAGDPDHRVPLQGNVAAVRRVTDPLRVGRTTETHFLFGAEYFGTWDRDVITGIGAVGLDPDGTVSVGELQDALRRTTIGAGLDRHVLDLVTIAWAIRHQRAWTQYSASIPQPQPGKLARDMQLQPQEMPSEEQWTTARHRAGAIFGLEAPQYLTAANVTTLAQQLRERASTLREDSHVLTTALTEASAQRGIAVSARLTAAQEGSTLVDDLAVLKGLPLLQRLADATFDATDQELGRSLSSAAGVTRAVRGLDPTRITPLTTGIEAGGDAGRTARGILQDLDDALAGHQLQRPLEKALSSFDDAAWTWMSRRASAAPAPAPQPDPEPATPTRSTGRRTVTWRGQDGLSELAREITNQVPDGARLEITWRQLP